MDLFNHHEDQQGMGLTYDLWKNFPVHQIFTLQDRNIGVGFNPDLRANGPNFGVNNTTVVYNNGFAGYTDSAEYIRPTLASEYDAQGATRIFATTDNQEAWMQGCNGGEPFVISDTAAECRDLVFECAFRVANITINKGGFFVGLMEGGLATNTIADAGTMADKDYIGLFKPEGNTSGVDLVYNLSGQTMVTHADDWQTIAALTWYHFGLRFNAKNKTITPWWGTGDRDTTTMAADTDNVITASDISSTTDYFPDGEYMAPIAGLKNAHADDYYIDLRLLACAQLAKAND
jgi:hypothetical protein